MQIPPSVYLNETNSNTSCECLISQSLDYAEAFILGDPFFRNFIVTLGYQWQDIQLFSKTVNTAIVPTPDPSPTPTPTPDNGGDDDSSGGLSGGAIFGIILAAVVGIAGIGVGLAYCARDNTPKDRHNSDSVAIEQTDES